MTPSQYWTEQITEEVINLVNSHGNDYDLKDSLMESLSKYNITKTDG